MNRLTTFRRRLRRVVLSRRRPLAALCAALAVGAAVQAHSPAQPRRTSVLTAVHDLAAGSVLRPEDVRAAAYDPDSVPSGSLSAAGAVGRTVAGPVRSGEPLTDARLVTSSLLAGYPGLVAVPLRIGDPGAVRLLRVGDRVDLLAADPQGRTARSVGADVPVLAIPRPGDDAPGLTSGALVVVGALPGEAPELAQASVTSVLSVVLTS